MTALHPVSPVAHRRAAVKAWLVGNERTLRGVAITVGLVAVGLQAIRILMAPSGDFINHWSWGARFLQSEFLYDRGSNIPYPPFWAMAFAPLSGLPPRVAQALCYPLSVIALLTLLRILRSLTREHLPIPSRAEFWIAAGALALGSRFILRDLADAGLNTLLVALTWSGVYLWARRRTWPGGVILGCAIALKPTAAIFVPYFLWRQQYRMAAATALAVAVLSLAPAIVQGPQLFRQHALAWSHNVWNGIASDDPRIGVLGLERVENISLRPALARYLLHIPEGDAGTGRFVHPLNVDILALAPGVASWIVRGAFASLALLVLWSVSRGRTSPGDLRALWDLTALGLLTLLISPITWRAHGVAAIPACYMILRHRASTGTFPPFARPALALFVVAVLVLNRGLMGNTVAQLVHSYYLYTWAFLALTIVALRAGRLASRERGTIGTAASVCGTSHSASYGAAGL